MGGARWTAEQDDTLRRMVSQHFYSAEIGKALGKSALAVDKRAERLGLNRRRSGVFFRVAAERVIAPEKRAAAKAARMAGYQAKKAEFAERRAANISKARMRQVGLADAPAHMIENYRQLMRVQGMRAPEAVAIVRDQFAHELRRALRQIEAVAALAIAEAKRQAEAERAYRRSFAGQIERVKAGAALVKVQRIARPAYADRSLTGNAEAML